MSPKKIAAAFIVIFVAIGGFVAGLILLRDNQAIEEKAAVPNGRATVSFNPATGNFKVGDTIQTAVYFNTDNIAVSGIAIRVRYPFTGTTPEVTVSSITVNPTLLSSGDWTCPTQNNTQQGGNVVIDIACANTSASGYSTNQNVLLANISLRIQRAPATSPLVLTFDPAESVITRRSDNQDVLLIPTSTGSFVIEGVNQPTNTVTVAPTTSVTTTGTKTPTPTLTKTPTGSVTGSTTKTPTPTAMPEAGISLPTYVGIGFGVAAIFAALLIAL